MGAGAPAGDGGGGGTALRPDQFDRLDDRPSRVAFSAIIWYILVYMKQLLVEIDDDMATQLERVAPTRSRRRSEFIRTAIRRALWELEERATARAYARQPDSAKEAYLDATVWEAGPRSRPRLRRRR